MTRENEACRDCWGTGTVLCEECIADGEEFPTSLLCPTCRGEGRVLRG